jgi:hypothetical protein
LMQQNCDSIILMPIYTHSDSWGSLGISQCAEIWRLKSGSRDLPRCWSSLQYCFASDSSEGTLEGVEVTHFFTFVTNWYVVFSELHFNHNKKGLIWWRTYPTKTSRPSGIFIFRDGKWGDTFPYYKRDM